jgi:dihydroxyacetone kinase-like predicted kinase
MMGIQIAEMGQLHTAVTRISCTYNNKDLKKNTIDAVKDQYLNVISDKIIGYENCMSLQLLTHLLTYYAMITSTELTQNYERLNTPYDHNQPIENIFQHIQDARAFVVAGGQPYGDVMIANVAFTLLFNTGFFPDACRA